MHIIARSAARGFTLVETVVAMVLTTIIAGFAAVFLATPVQMYLSQTRRAELSSAAEAALRHIDNDVRVALPNSVRSATIGSRRILEVIAVDRVAIYREAGTEGDTLVTGPGPTPPDASFAVLESLAPLAGFHVVVNNLGIAGNSAYQLTNVITPAAGASIDPADDKQVLLAPPFRFVNGSPSRRAYLVRSVIRYECDLTNRTLVRYQNLPITPVVALVGAPATLIARDVSACTFIFQRAPNNPPPNNAQHGGVLSVDMTVSRVVGANTERLRLMRQITIENAS